MRSWRQWGGLFVELIGAARGLGVIWNPVKASCTLLEGNTNWMMVSFTDHQNYKTWKVINVYRPTTMEKKRYGRRFQFYWPGLGMIDYYWRGF